MSIDTITKEKLAELICGDDQTKHPIYRSSQYLTRFFQDIGIYKNHDGSTRKWWVLETLKGLNDPELKNVVLRLVDPKLYGGDIDKIKLALNTVNEILATEDLAVKFNGAIPELIRQKAVYDFSEKLQEQELQPLPPPDFNKLNLPVGLAEVLEKRWDEIQKCIDVGATVGAVILMGSMLEGFLLGVMLKHPKQANSAQNAPKKIDGSVKAFHDWKLSEMIDVGHDIGWIELDVKKFSHALREFRNIIHPYEQTQRQTYPDIDTCKISWLVVQAASNDIASWISKNP